MTLNNTNQRKLNMRTGCIFEKQIGYFFGGKIKSYVAPSLETGLNHLPLLNHTQLGIGLAQPFGNGE